LQRLVIEFSHPGKQFLPSKRRLRDDRFVWCDESRSDGLRSWNNEKAHKRKFLTSRGMCRTTFAGDDIQGILSFWGEWEPQSRFRLLDNGPPYYVHTPFIVEGSTGRHNTDPFVFGELFWFTNCKQNTRPFLKDLSPGSLILFGTECRWRQAFALDTVFVVGDRLTLAQCAERPAILPKQLRLATLDHPSVACNPDLVFYSGKSPAVGKPFSFVPCRRADHFAAVQGHERVFLDCKAFGFQNPGAGTVCTRLMRSELTTDGISEAKVVNFWNRIANECFNQDFFLGHSIELPPIA
jgi:hypothetical protein